MKHKIAVCDDSCDFKEILVEFINNILEKNNINCNVSTFCSGYDIIEACGEEEYDIIFLDMEMPGLNGIETGLRIREISNDAIIFYITSHKEFAYESYQVRAKNYLLKPLDINLLENAILEGFEEINEKKKKVEFLDVKDTMGAKHRIPIDDITHIIRKKEDRKLHILTKDNKDIILVQTLENIEKELSDLDYIVKSSKSCLINIRNVRTIVKNTIYFINDEVEYASRRCLPSLISKLNII